MILTIEKIKKTFVSGRKSIPAVDDISFSLRRGEFLCLVGPSGCGKSTLLNLIAGLEKATGGQITLDGKAIREPGVDRTVIFQESALFPWLSVISNVEFGMKMAGLPKEARREKALQYLQMVNLLDFRDAWVHELSGGMKQRVALARALSLDSELLLMDEPFAALDNQTRQMLQAELLEIWQETRKTILFVTHSVEEAVLLADRIIVMTPGPGKIKREFIMNAARPRLRHSPELARTIAAIAMALGSEVDDIAFQDQVGGSPTQADPVLSGVDRHLADIVQSWG